MSSSEEWAWAAGFFDGEGCVSVKRQKQKTRAGTFVYSYPVVQMTSTDRSLLERFQRIVGAGKIVDNPHRARDGYERKMRWHFSIYRRTEVERVINSLAPWLGESRLQQARDALVVRDPELVIASTTLS